MHSIRPSENTTPQAFALVRPFSFIRRRSFFITAAIALLPLCLISPSSLLAGPKPDPTKADISYGPHPHQLLDTYIPPHGSGPFPAVIWYGGIWKSTKGVPDVNTFFPHGIALIGVQVRGMEDAITDKISPPVSTVLLDARRAVQYVRLHAGQLNIDPNRIALGGGSQGTLPALFVGCSGEKADPKAADPVERTSSKVVCVGAWRSQPTIDPKQMQEWVPGVKWGAPAFGCSFEESLARREELLPLIKQWSPEKLLNKDSAPICFGNEWGLAQPENVTEGNYKTHSPAWGVGFKKESEKFWVRCCNIYPGHPEPGYNDFWDFLIKELKAAK